ncbi:uncharacterized protein LOC102803972, partial [Saccoglossus kowalevskii]|uniref:Uncharacterized protein LOC102803972 n=1 Tax=Saccoglossus kowalevskii TaxID=10224 RepID=A0ABM0MG80_SACKO
GPIAAGFFSCPALKFDALNIAILRNFPYLLPCLICIILCIFALIGSFVYLEETMADMTEVYADIPASHSDLRSPVEEPANENLINHNQDTQDITKYSINTPDDEVNVSKRRAWFCCGCCPCAKKRYHRFGEKENSLTCFGRCKIGVHKIVQPMKDRRVYLLTIIQCLLAFVAGVHAELIPLLLVTDYKHGGYDLDTSEISFMYSLMSVIEVIYQLAVYPSIVKNIGFKHTLKVGLVMFGVTASLIPTLNRIAGPISRPSTHNITILLPLNTASAEEITSLEDNVQKRVEDLTLSSETETDLLHHSNTLHFMSTDNEQIVNSKITYGNSLMNNTKPKYSDLQLSAVPWTNVTDNLIKQCKLLSESRKDEHVSLWRIPVKVWAVLVVFITASTISRMTAFVSMNVLVGNACLAKDKGTVYGVAQSLTALVRSTAPAVGGNIFAWSEHNDLPWPFDYHLTFYLLSVILIFTCFVSCLLPTSVNKKRTEEDTIA